MDRKEISRALAMALAYMACGNFDLAAVWAQHLVDALRAAGLEIR